MAAEILSERHIKLAQTPLTKDLELCHEVATPPLSQITHLVKRQPEAIERGLTAVDSELVIPTVGEIDLIAISGGRLVMVSTFTELVSEHLGRAAGIKLWAIENGSVLKRVYQHKGLGKNILPRIIFLCSDIHPRARQLMFSIADLSLEIFKYRCLESANTQWLIIEKVLGLSHVPLKTHVELTEEEIGDFFRNDDSPSLFLSSKERFEQVNWDRK